MGLPSLLIAPICMIFVSQEIEDVPLETFLFFLQLPQNLILSGINTVRWEES